MATSIELYANLTIEMITAVASLIGAIGAVISIIFSYKTKTLAVSNRALIHETRQRVEEAKETSIAAKEASERNLVAIDESKQVSLENRGHLADLADKIDGRIESLLSVASDASRAQGNLEGRAEQIAERTAERLADLTIPHPPDSPLIDQQD